MVAEKSTEPIAAAEYERVICQVKGVLSARLVTGVDGQIEEIHVLATPDRNPKQVVRDIETAVLVQLGTTLDRKKISVAQLEEGVAGADHVNEAGASCGRARRTQLRLVRLGFFSRGIRLEANVTVEIGEEGNFYEGSAIGANMPGKGCYLVAQATLEAIKKYLGESCILTLEDLLQLEVAKTRAILVVIGMLGDWGRERLAGIAFLDESPDELQATGTAVLRALACRFCIHVHT
ncbi:hypothetical protein SAMN00808754_0446 [Thermanaeromonas toyohensis ToBE]|uniref:Uncharacterized protein n=1 Tax=Thermanaeromonas toyohensis ToBE TaxID=698762 RepID=A0A1W1VDK0_9FIRM|nr:hypothetical protein [Thermanaeromonas toyohensis]SMB91448.1 hypothetical protein SAMN00808754_0446 [Thermanaeromonas toyohensis ToBE]